MNQDEIILEQYKIFTQQKENFIERSFFTNKFYLILVLAIIVTMFLTKSMVLNFGLSTTLLLSIAGIAICVMWWINVDSYNLLIKVKLSKVIEGLEKKLPVQPYTDEFVALTELRNSKRSFLFSDIQKALATFSLILFLVLFINELVILSV